LKTVRVISLASLLIVIGISSCSKTGPAGATGPAGSAGTAGTNGTPGAAGPAGATGATGAKGDTGPDSVQYSPWITLNPVGGFDKTGHAIYVATIQAPAITAAILSSGTVTGYLYMPDDLVVGDSTIIGADNFLNVVVNEGKITIWNYYDFSGYKYRYVVIPGKIAVTNAAGQVTTYTADQLKSMEYSKLTTLLHIPAKGGSRRLQ